MPFSYKRRLEIDLPQRQSAFLWGPRQSGKTSYLKSNFGDSVYFDLLNFAEVDRFTLRPTALGDTLAELPEGKLRYPIIIDEIQNVPRLLNEVHRLIETRGLSFILCGSSARKLKRPGVNLLGGRAWRFNMFPLSKTEIPDFDLLRAINHGLLPRHYIERDPWNLDSYLNDYLETEIYNEAYVRDVVAFTRFFKALSYCHGELLNFNGIAQDCGVHHHTARSYFQILVDTLVGYLIYPFTRSTGRQTILRAPKFYLFDVGVAGRICDRTVSSAAGNEFGRAFEHYILMEIWMARSLLERRFQIQYWRTKSGYEVDFILGDGEVAIEVKSRVRRQRDLRPINAFINDYKPKRAIVVVAENEARRIGNVEVLPYGEFIAELQAGDLI
ncbi:MAG: AAA family ATPase [Gammaproteobacteria bacterium]|nr:AAA family ATPase [Gammaproteobacteria bacterium]